MKIIFSVVLAAVSPFLYAQEFVDGWIVQKNDTVNLKILKHKKRRDDNLKNYQRITILSDNGEKELLPSDISAYQKEGVIYKSFTENIRSQLYAFFGREIIHSKRIQLYRLEGMALGIMDYCLFRKSDREKYYTIDAEYVIDINKDTFGNTRTDSNGDLVSMDLHAKSNEERVFSFLANYLSDCPLVRNKIKSKFYTIYDLELIFTEYNNCP